EDGIRDPLVTGVQTCALPIYPHVLPWLSAVKSVRFPGRHARALRTGRASRAPGPWDDRPAVFDLAGPVQYVKGVGPQRAEALAKIGRASCREREEVSGGDVAM